MRAAGRAPHLARHEAASPSPSPTARRLTRDARTRALSGGGPTLVETITERPGEKRAASMHVCRPLAHTPQVRPGSPGNEECPPSPTAGGRGVLLLILVESLLLLLRPAHERDAREDHGHADDLVRAQLLAEEPPAEHRGDRGVHIGIGA